MADALEILKLGDTKKVAVQKVNDVIDQVTDNANNIVGLQEQLTKLPDNDTKNTAGATIDAASTLYLIGAKNTTANPQTYTGNAYMSKGVLYSKSQNIENPSYQPTLTQDDYTKIMELLGELAGGMHYEGTLIGGTSSEPTRLPAGEQLTSMSGATYKVSAAGVFQYSTLPSIGATTGAVTHTITADVGDLIILSLDIGWWSPTWTLVPSGDDGDVYADGSFPENSDALDGITLDGDGGKIILSYNDGNNPKRVKASTARILRWLGNGVDLDALADDVPSLRVVLNLLAKLHTTEKLDSSNFQIDTAYGNTSTHLDNDNNYRLITKNVVTSMPIAAYNTSNTQMVVDIGTIPSSGGVTGNRIYIIIHKDLKNDFGFVLAG